MPSKLQFLSAVSVEVTTSWRLQDLPDTAPVLILLPGLTGKQEDISTLLVFALATSLSTFPSSGMCVASGGSDDTYVQHAVAQARDAGIRLVLFAAVCHCPVGGRYQLVLSHNDLAPRPLQGSRLQQPWHSPRACDYAAILFSVLHGGHQSGCPACPLRAPRVAAHGRRVESGCKHLGTHRPMMCEA